MESGLCVSMIAGHFMLCPTTVGKKAMEALNSRVKI